MLFISNELDAINLILASIGEAPVNSISNAESVDVDNAIRALETVSRSIQRKGWLFNTYTDMVFQPDTLSKRIRYNPSWIDIIATDGKTYVKRGDYVYNLTDKTYEFSEDLTLTIIEALAFDDLPDVFKTYITAKAAIQFQARYLGDENISQELYQEAAESYADLVQYSIDTGANMYQITGMQSLLQRS